ncbi:hypothetical protein AB0C81_03975 [Streptomyces roseoverticillatus]|uniref:hypothetical protein n=1 Tax=Streptomyces roseoverticillatus TaxID=66429 RepID=UPI0033C5C8B2
MTRIAALQHPNAGITLMSRWITGTPERSRAAADAQRAWADARAAALTDAGYEGLLAAHFHLTVGGERVVEIAEWASAAGMADLEAAHGPWVPHSRYRFYR